MSSSQSDDEHDDDKQGSDKSKESSDDEDGQSSDDEQSKPVSRQNDDQPTKSEAKSSLHSSSDSSDEEETKPASDNPKTNVDKQTKETEQNPSPPSPKPSKQQSSEAEPAPTDESATKASKSSASVTKATADTAKNTKSNRSTSEKAPAKATTSKKSSSSSQDRQAGLQRVWDNLIADTLKLGDYNTKEDLLNEKDPKALLYWAKNITSHCDKQKATAKQQQTSADVIHALLRMAFDKFQMCADLDPGKSFAVRATGTPATDGFVSFELSDTSNFPVVELACEWATAAYRLGVAINQRARTTKKSASNDNAQRQFRTALSLCSSIIAHEPAPRNHTARALNLSAKALVRLPELTEVDGAQLSEMSDLFIVQLRTFFSK